MFPFEFRGAVRHQKNRVMGLPCGKSCMILASTVFWLIQPCVGQTARRWRPQCNLTPPPPGTLAKICIHPIFSERLIGLHFCRWYYGSSFIRLAVVASQNANLRQIPWKFAFVAVQGHPRSSILVSMESARTSSYWSLIVTMVPSCTVSEIRRLIGWKLRIFHTPLLFGAHAPYVPLRISRRGSAWEN